MEIEKYKRCNDCDGCMPLDTEFCIFCRSRDLSIKGITSHKVILKLNSVRNY